MAGFDRVKNIVLTPNFMTISRIIAVPLIVILLIYETKITTFSAAILFSLASITDYLDGYLARTRGLVTKLGKSWIPWQINFWLLQHW